MRTRHAVPIQLLLLAGLWLAASPAASLVLEVDPAASHVGGTPASGSIVVEVGQALPVPSRTTFDLRSVDVAAGSLAVGLDPDLERPGSGIVDPDGSFLVPTLYLLLDEGGVLSRLVIPNLVGSIRAGGDGCAHTYCLDTSFSVSTSSGLVQITISAIPEPGTAALVGLGLFGLARAARRKEHGR